MENKNSGRDQDSHVCFSGSHGGLVRAGLLRVNRHTAGFEVYGIDAVLRQSEALSDFKVILDGRTVYSGRAVVHNLVTTGVTQTCEVTLEDAWIESDLLEPLDRNGRLLSGYNDFLRRWQKIYKILPEFKIVIADMQTFLVDLRVWLEQIELGIRSAPPDDWAMVEREVAQSLAEPVRATLNGAFDKFEEISARVDPEMLPVYQAYMKRHLHPLVLCSPFAHRTFTKPLGYAGDYEMVNMILRDPLQGDSLYAKLINAWFISQPPAEAHRNRIKYLTTKLLEETARIAFQGKTARIFDLGCGPAWQVQNFLAEQHVSDRAEFTLLDFNDETVAYTSELLENLKQEHGRSTKIEFIKKSVMHVLKGGAKGAFPEGANDLVYCAGLFDYLPDRVCRELMNIFYRMLAPGGLLIVTNVDSSNPIRHMLDYLLEWNLIYRNGRELLALSPDESHPDYVTVRADLTGVNIYLEVRKPSR